MAPGAQQADTTASLAAINNIPCTCRWLFFAKQLNAAVTFPHGPLAELLGGFSLPRTFDCPKDPRSGKFRCGFADCYRYI